MHTGSFHLCWTRWHQEHKMKLKEFSPIKWHPISIFYARSVAFVLNINFVASVSDLGNTQSILQIKFKWKLSRTPMTRPSVGTKEGREGNFPGCTYRVNRQVWDYILLIRLHHVYPLPCQFRQFCSCPSKIRVWQFNTLVVFGQLFRTVVLAILPIWIWNETTLVTRFGPKGVAGDMKETEDLIFW